MNGPGRLLVGRMAERTKATVLKTVSGSVAGPSEVLVSSTVKDLVAGSGLIFWDAGEHELKGVPERWHLYRVVNERA
jgi:class 3 adenylate cyclase